MDLKVVLLGKEYGGKTSLVERYIHNKFNSNAPYQSVSSVAKEGPYMNGHDSDNPSRSRRW